MSQYFDAGSETVTAYIGALWRYRLWDLFNFLFQLKRNFVAGIVYNVVYQSLQGDIS